MFSKQEEVGLRAATIFFGMTLGVCSTSVRAAAQTTPTPTWVHCPGALIRSDCIHPIPLGAMVDEDGNVTLKGQLLAHYGQCPEAPIIDNTPLTPGTVYPQAAPGGWVEGAQRNVSLPANEDLDFIYSEWQVPGNPTPPYVEQTIFLFDALEPTNGGGGTIVQAVLGWGPSESPGSGEFWSISTWLANSSGGYPSPSYQVNPGDYVEGEVYTISQSGNTITWYMEMYDGDGTWVYSEANSYGYQWTQAYVGILEAYNITLCSQFPDNYIPYEFWDTELYSNPGYTLNSYGNGFTGMLYAYNNNMSPSYQGPNCGWSGSYLNLGADGDGWVFAF